MHESRAKLLDAALHVFRERGYAASTIDDVCIEAGLTKGSFFHHFASKEELALAAAERFSTMAADLFRAAPYHTPSDPLERVLGYVDFRAALLDGALPDVTCLLGTMVQETYETHPAIRAACDHGIADHVAEISRDIALAKAQYAPDAPWDPESIARFTQAVLQGAFILAKARHDAAVAAESVAHLRRYIELLFDRRTTSPPTTTQETDP